jgi:plastocyanin
LRFSGPGTRARTTSGRCAAIHAPRRPDSRRTEDTIVKRSIMCAAALATAAGLPAAAVAHVGGAAAKTYKLPATNFKFGAKKNNVIKAKVGDKLTFTWKEGVHNVLSTKSPAGFKKVNTGRPTPKHAPLTVTLSKKGAYQFICAPHVTLGMKVTVNVS